MKAASEVGSSRDHNKICLLWKSKVHYCAAHKKLSLAPILRQLNLSTHSKAATSSEIHVNVIL
jgi:hypothetical protein